MDEHGVLYVAWGEEHIREAIESSRSLIGNYQTCLVTDSKEDLTPYFSSVKAIEFTELMYLHPHIRRWIALSMTPYPVTCMLDTDCVSPNPDLDLGFVLARKYGFATTLSPGMTFGLEGTEYVHYNAGITFFRGYQKDLMQEIFRVASENNFESDEAALSVALRNLCINPAVLPACFNFVRAGQIHDRLIRIYHSPWKPVFSKIRSDGFGNDFPVGR